EGYHPLEILKCFTELLPRKDAALEIITSASGDGAESIKQYKKLFKKLGIENIQHIHHNTRKEVLEDDLEQRVKEADGFFFTGCVHRYAFCTSRQARSSCAGCGHKSNHYWDGH